jgi:polyphosphate glucokinase
MPRRLTETGTPGTAAGPVSAPTAAGPVTVAFDIGGTGLKAARLDSAGRLLGEQVRLPTRYPCPPQRLVDDLVQLAAAFADQRPAAGFDRVSAGFPGVVREGLVLTAPHFVTTHGPGSRVSAPLTAQWARFDLASALEQALHRPTRVANDADLQGAAVVRGHGLEMVITLGTGLGSALYRKGRLAVHLELAHHPFREDETYNEQLGERARRRIGDRAWNSRVARAVAQLRALVVYDHLFVGGGNSRRVSVDLGPDVTIVDNSAGLAGGVSLWRR